ncbi:Gfo/Idh/MocA family protein [Microvirga sp. 2TAF3]|uniref:Gfo/Idh/MocA family protein n=1 Tax=Microvirga sp. 2TAF3 TaxID=3233014 RepID=UPI003F9CA578
MTGLGNTRLGKTGLGIGLIGTGYMGKCHALAWNAVAPVFGDVARPNLAMLAEASQDLAERKARELGFARATGDWRSLVTDPAVDVVSITTPNAFHPEMAIAALEAGKHVWCEKPMATKLADAERMLEAARTSGKVAVLGYNYIQNPIIRLIRRLLDEGQIGEVNHVRIEMDEDFMADPEELFYWKSEASSGHGALDDFGVHPLSLIWTLLGGVRRVFGHMAKPYADRPIKGGARRAVETYDIATTLIELENGASGIIALNRSAWGRKGRIFVQLFGSKGTIVYDQERMNEVQIYTTDMPKDRQGFRTILASPLHAPYDKFIPAPGHGLGFNELKIIECHALIRRIDGEAATIIDFEGGIRIERIVDAVARSAHEERWIEVESGEERRAA